MPRRTDSQGLASAFMQVRQHARAALTQLRKEIRTREAEIKRLKTDEASLGRLAGRTTTRSSEGTPAGRRMRARVNWGAVLQSLPSEFTAADLRLVRTVKHKRSSEIFAAITRWIDAGLARRKSRGVYERVQ
ncbi:MAG TPA: hypothetical protein VJN94_01350 [Candidatus Binataceae bacterium]|nr:hypothetical protein [Candidatus Binataceae bacterium]